MGYILFGLLLFIVPYGLLIYLIFNTTGLVDKVLVVITLCTLIVDKLSLDMDIVAKLRDGIAKFFATSALVWFFGIGAVLSALSAIIWYQSDGPWYTSLVMAVVVGAIACFLYCYKEKIETSKGIAFAIWYMLILCIYVANWMYVANK